MLKSDKKNQYFLPFGNSKLADASQPKKSGNLSNMKSQVQQNISTEKALVQQGGKGRLVEVT